MLVEGYAPGKLVFADAGGQRGVGASELQLLMNVLAEGGDVAEAARRIGPLGLPGSRSFRMPAGARLEAFGLRDGAANGALTVVEDVAGWTAAAACFRAVFGLKYMAEHGARNTARPSVMKTALRCFEFSEGPRPGSAACVFRMPAGLGAPDASSEKALGKERAAALGWPAARAWKAGSVPVTAAERASVACDLADEALEFAVEAFLRAGADGDGALPSLKKAALAEVESGCGYYECVVCGRVSPLEGVRRKAQKTVCGSTACESRMAVRTDEIARRLYREGWDVEDIARLTKRMSAEEIGKAVRPFGA